MVYAKADDHELKLDLYWHPDAKEPEPLIAWVHGGAWRGGDKAEPLVALRMLRLGYAVASINYRLSSEAIFPAQIHDCKAAIRWLRSKAPDYNVDPDQFGAWGLSAGGHLVAMLGTSGDVVELEGNLGVTDGSSRVQAVCDWYGPTDFLRMNDTSGNIDHDAIDSPETQLIGGKIQDHPGLADRANPITYIGDDTPPFLILHGAKDRVVLPNQSEALHEALQRSGVSSTLVMIEDQGHGFDKSIDIHKHSYRFFDQHLKGRESDWVPPAENPRPWTPAFDADPPGAQTRMFKPAVTDEYYAFTVFLPESYADSSSRYPVVYYLHGRNGRPHRAEAFMTRARDAMAAGRCPEMVIVGVNGLHASMYCDSKDGTRPVETVIVRDVIPYVEATFRVKDHPGGRAIDGFSMGGFGAAHLGFRHHSLFNAISILGAAIHRPDFLREERVEIFEQTFGNDMDYCRQESPWMLVREHAEALREKTIRLHVGEKDERLCAKNIDFHELMDTLNILHDFSVVPDAGHNSGQVLDNVADPWAFYRRAFGDDEGVKSDDKQGVAS